jgi:hypothetical protein
MTFVITENEARMVRFNFVNHTIHEETVEARNEILPAATTNTTRHDTIQHSLADDVLLGRDSSRCTTVVDIDHAT